MASARFAVARLAVTAALVLGGCAATTTPTTAPPAASTTAAPAASEAAPPVPILEVGSGMPIDLIGNGHATVTVVAAETAQGAPLVATVAIKLDKLGKPLSGGPENFRFLDAAKELHEARTDPAHAPVLGPVNLTSAGQEVSGKILFDVTPEQAKGGHFQLMTGRLVHAIWKL